jgi:hypothetical protein
MKISGLLLLLGASVSAHAEQLQCKAAYDEGSHYELVAGMKDHSVQGAVNFRYVTTDGVDLHQDLAVKSQAIVPGQKLQLRAENSAAGVTVEAPYQMNTKNYRGTIRIGFDVEHDEPFDLDVTCVLL